jgi:hypothetical protein
MHCCFISRGNHSGSFGYPIRYAEGYMATYICMKPLNLHIIHIRIGVTWGYLSFIERMQQIGRILLIYERTTQLSHMHMLLHKFLLTTCIR